MRTGSHDTGSNTAYNIPAGFRFVPTDEELVSYYLKKKVMGELLPSGVVADAEVYKVEPWRLPGTPAYFFLHIRRVFRNNKVKGLIFANVLTEFISSFFP